MQLGTRWSVGAEPPAAVPPVLRRVITQVESTLGDDPSARSARWTLTWLEGRPVAELDGGPIVTLDSADTPVIVTDLDEEPEQL